MIHKLKLEKQFYESSLNNEKTFEIRLNDRNFKVNDILLLCEIDDCVKFTGRCHFKEVKYILNSDYTKEKYVILSTSNSFIPEYLNQEYVSSLPEKELNRLFKSRDVKYQGAYFL